MNIVVTKNDLSKALQLVQSAVAKRTTMPILSNLLLSAEGKSIRVSASDLELSAVAQVQAEVKSAGNTTINAKIFGDIVRELPEGEIRLVLTEGERLEVSAKGSKFKIIGASAEEYPTLPGLSCAAPDKLSAHLFLEMINKTLYAVSHDETRFNLNGVCFEHLTEADKAAGEKQAKSAKGKKNSGALLRMVATDGHRLALTTRPVNSLGFEGRVIVPRKALSEIRRVLELEGEKDVGIGIVDGFFVLETSDFKMASRLIEAQYPDYSQVLPQQKGTLVSMKSGDVSQALRRVMLMVTDREKGVRLSFSAGALRISSSSPELGEATEEISVNYEGSVLNIGFNAGYLLEVAGTLAEAEGLVMELHGEVGPGKFYAEQDEASLAIVMPMRL